MPRGGFDLQLHGATLTLLPEGAVFIPSTRTLAVADLHWGKAETFRLAGIPVPDGIQSEDGRRLDDLVRRHEAQRLVILGDLLHGPDALGDRVLDALQSFVAGCPAEVIILLGNHDRRFASFLEARRLPAHTGILDEAPLRFAHEPSPAPDRLTLAGHLHPVVRLTSRSDRLRLPCFRLETETLTLPAFGRFTGGYDLRPAHHHRLFACTPHAVVEV